jgi:hypothetical protein
MNRRVASGAALIFLAACGAGSDSEAGIEGEELTQLMSQVRAGPTLRAKGRTLPVPSAKYPTIASALAVAQAGDRVRVAAGIYAECLDLKDGVTLEGHVVRGEPAATLDGTGCPTCVVCGDASIVHGASLRWFRIQAPSRAIHLLGAKGVHVLGVSIAGAGVGFLSEQSSFVLERSHVSDNQGRAGALIRHGSQGILIGNDIQGRNGGVLIENGHFYEEPGWAPSRGLLVDNYIHDSGGRALDVFGKGSSVHGIGNRYERSALGGVSVTGGATYVGRRESMAGNMGNGLDALGCGLLCRAPGCSDPGDPVLVQEASVATLDSATIRENHRAGVYAACGATIRIHKSTLAQQETGARLESTFRLDGSHQSSAPSSLIARDTSFTANTLAGILLAGTGTRLEGFGNRYSANAEWGITIFDGAEYLGHGDTIAANKNDGLLLWMGTKAEGFGNRYEGNLSGISLNGGATYTGHADTFIDNGWGGGIWALGCVLVCANPDCTELAVSEGRTKVELYGATIRGSHDGAGVFARCGAKIVMKDGAVAGNRTGADVASTYQFDESHTSSVPSSLDAHGTLFAENDSCGVSVSEDSRLALGSLASPGKNSFLANAAGSIANHSASCVPAQWNWFGTTDAAVIASSLIGCGEFVPFLKHAPYAPSPPWRPRRSHAGAVPCPGPAESVPRFHGRGDLVRGMGRRRRRREMGASGALPGRRRKA